MVQKSDYLIIGGGIIGLSIGYELAKRGGTVTILEQREWGAEASAAAAGMLAPLKEFKEPSPILDLGMQSLAMYREWARELQEESEVDVHLAWNGILTVALGEREAHDLAAKYAWQKAAGYDVTWLEGAALQEVEPLLSSEARAAIFAEKEGQVNNELVIQALLRACQNRGVQLVQGVVVTGLITSGGVVQGAETTAGAFYADQTVLAAGAWAGMIAERLNVALPVFPVHGQIASVSAKGIPLSRIVFGTQGYMVPKKDGRIIVGATEDFIGFQKEVTAEGLTKVFQGTLPYVPALRSAAFIKAWSGLRPGTKDGLPILGALPEFRGLTFACGHFRNGILLAPITARLICDWLINGEKTALLPFGPERFLVGSRQ